MSSIFPAQMARRASDSAFEHLRDAIVGLELPPGSALSDRDLCEKLNMSRTPVREALLRLSNIGLVEIRPQSGTFVSRIRMAEVHEANFIRRELEGACAREAAKVISASQKKELVFLIEQQKLDHSKQNAKVFSRLDGDFHAAIHTIAGNAMCRMIIRDVRMFVDRLRNLSLHRPADLDEILVDHTAIAQALIDEDSRAAEREMNRHMDRVDRVAKTLIAQYPEYFERADV
jgi:GntR family transcriptional regulator, rspAB operon transcriptional repressor